MVYENISSKSKILTILRSSEKPVSGDELAAETNTSRTAVWKNIHALCDAGYKISSSRNGYELKKDLEDSLCPWEFGKNESNFLHFKTIDSTMNRARKIAEDSDTFDTNGDFTRPSIITSDFQTDGKGRGNHSWENALGSLAFTHINFLKNEKINAAEEYRIQAAALISTAKVLEEISGRKFFIRWPNDIWSTDGKVCGILDEYNAQGSLCRWINIGIGINFKETPVFSGKNKNYADCVFKDKSSVSRSVFLNRYLSEFEKQKKIAVQNDSELENEFNSLCCDYRKTVILENGTSAVFNGINKYGWGKFLILESEKKSNINTKNKTRLEKIFPPG